LLTTFLACWTFVETQIPNILFAIDKVITAYSSYKMPASTGGVSHLHITCISQQQPGQQSWAQPAQGQRLRRERHVGGGEEGSEYDGGKHSEGK